VIAEDLVGDDQARPFVAGERPAGVKAQRGPALPSEIQPIVDHAADAGDLDGPAGELGPAGVVGQIIDADVIIGDQHVQGGALAGVELDPIHVVGDRVGAGQRPRPVGVDHEHGRVPAARHHPGRDVDDALRAQLGLVTIQQHLDKTIECANEFG
jgi:hypothetical protein